MTREEAIKFYTSRLARAKSENGRIAYATILSALEYEGVSYAGAKAVIQGNSHMACVPNAYRRAIYRRAVGELNI